MKRVSLLAVLVLLLAASALPAAAIVGGELDGETDLNVGLMIAEYEGVPVPHPLCLWGADDPTT